MHVKKTETKKKKYRKNNGPNAIYPKNIDFFFFVCLLLIYSNEFYSLINIWERIRKEENETQQNRHRFIHKFYVLY